MSDRYDGLAREWLRHSPYECQDKRDELAAHFRQAAPPSESGLRAALQANMPVPFPSDDLEDSACVEVIMSVRYLRQARTVLSQTSLESSSQARIELTARENEGLRQALRNLAYSMRNRSCSHIGSCGCEVVTDYFADILEKAMSATPHPQSICATCGHKAMRHENLTGQCDMWIPNLNAPGHFCGCTKFVAKT